VYSCQQLKRIDRITHRHEKLRRRLGDPFLEDSLYPLDWKPKGMHQTTFNRIRALDDSLRYQIIGDAIRRFGMFDELRDFLGLDR
jgi:hypothetical protein